MEFFKKNNPDSNEIDKKDIVYSKSVKAGKRIYYLDVKQSRNREWYLAITESKRNVVDNGGVPDVRFEKHKIFLYPEDMQHFTDALTKMVDFIRNHQPELFDKYSKEIPQSDFGAPDADNEYKPLEFKMEDFD